MFTTSKEAHMGPIILKFHINQSTQGTNIRAHLIIIENVFMIWH